MAMTSLQQDLDLVTQVSRQRLRPWQNELDCTWISIPRPWDHDTATLHWI